MTLRALAIGRPIASGAVPALALVLAGCGGTVKQAQPRPPFAVDCAPLDAQDKGRVNHGKYPVAVRDVSFVSTGGRVQAYLVVPPGARRLPAVIYVTGTGGRRSDLVLPAVWLAGRRAVALTLTPPSSAAPNPPAGESPEQELARETRLATADVLAVRCAVAYLRSLTEVDPARMGYVGWSLGARTGAIAAAVEPRLRAVVLMSGGASPVSSYVNAAPARLRAAVRRELTAVDPLRWIARARRSTILLQDGRRDHTVPHAALLALAHAAPKGTELRWYPAGHPLSLQAYRDQLAWLTRKLGIRGPAVPGARTGP